LTGKYKQRLPITCMGTYKLSEISWNNTFIFTLFKRFKQFTNLVCNLQVESEKATRWYSILDRDVLIDFI